MSRRSGNTGMSRPPTMAAAVSSARRSGLVYTAASGISAKRRQLRLPLGGQTDVGLPLHAAEEIALRLSVADKEYLGHVLPLPQK